MSVPHLRGWQSPSHSDECMTHAELLQEIRRLRVLVAEMQERLAKEADQ